MSTDTTINSDEIEAVAAKIDKGGELDDHDKAVLRALFLLAGEAASHAVEDDVTGFSLDTGAQNAGFGLSLNFTMPTQLDGGSVGGAFTAGRSLRQACCTGKHFREGRITT